MPRIRGAASDIRLQVYVMPLHSDTNPRPALNRGSIKFCLAHHLAGSALAPPQHTPFCMKRLSSRLALVLSALALLLPTTALAACSEEDSMPAEACRHARQLWAEGGDDLYIPLHTHHLRSAYADEQIARFNETPWGLGYGRSRIKDDRWESLYGMVFQDSNNKPEPMIGYGYQWLWGNPQSLRAGLGYTVLVTARNDIASYMPLPGILPIGSLQYGKVSLNTAYVPGGRGFGNIFFFWSRIEL